MGRGGKEKRKKKRRREEKKKIDKRRREEIEGCSEIKLCAAKKREDLFGVRRSGLGGGHWIGVG